MNLKKMLAGLLFPVAISLSAQTAPGMPQMVTPAQYPALSHSERQYYVAGIIDTDRLLFQQTKPLFATCLTGSTLEQITEIVDRELGALAPELRSSMPIAAHNALVVACNSGETTEKKLSTDTLLGIYGLGFGVAGALFGIVGVLFAYLSVTAESVRTRLLRWKAKGFPETFKKLAEAYRRAERIEDEASRVRRKDDIALAMAYFSMGSGLSREAIASIRDEGYLAALAKLVQTAPERKDARLLVKAATVDAPPHARYQVMFAVEKLSAAGCLSTDDFQSLRDMLRHFRKDMGPKHHGRMDATMVVLRQGQLA